MSTTKYILEGKRAVRTDDVLKWARAFTETNRRVAQTLVRDILVSTVFLGIDHNFFDAGRPILFETMVFQGDKGDFTERYATWEEAELGHFAIVERVKRGEKLGDE